jgi:hypothetical protein
MLWIGLLIGIFLGANVGFVVLAMCISSKQGDKLKKVPYD